MVPERQEPEGGIRGKGTANRPRDVHGGEPTPQLRGTWTLKSTDGGEPHQGRKTPEG